MVRKASAPLIILVVLVIISLGLAGGGFFLFQKERAKARGLEQKIEEIDSKQKVTEAKLKESQKLISETQSKLQEAKLQIDSLSSDLQRERTGRLEASSKLEQLRVDLEQQKSLRMDLEKKFNQAQEDARKAQGRLNELESQKAELQTKVKELEAKTQNVELGSIVVSPEATAEAPLEEKEKAAGQAAPLEGKVLVINKDYNFAVINLGSKDGVNLNDVFSLYHKNKYIGDVKVEKVHESMSAAGFVSGDLKDKVNEGDKAVQKVK